MSHKSLAISIILLALLTLLTNAFVRAQDDQCRAIVQSAWHSMSQHCAELPRASVCYGSESVHASFQSDADFETPASIAPLADLESLRTAGLNLDAAQWGIAALYLSADLPLDRAENGIVILLSGAAAMTHDLDLDALDSVGEAISSAALEATTVYAHPSIVAEVRDQLDADAIALVDARDTTGDWLRLVNDGEIAWAQRAKLARLSAMDALPIVDAGHPFPMQAFTFSSSVDFPECDAAAPILAIQTPDDVTMDLRINGVDVSVTGLISARQVQRSAISFHAHRGRFSTESGTVKAGQSALAIVSGGAILDFSGALPASDAERELGETLQLALNQLANANGWREYTSAMPEAQVIHAVQPGDSLYAIARRYETQVDAIIRANGHSAPFPLAVGSDIIIPEPGSGFGGLGGAASNPAQSAGDCASLRLTSPMHIAPRGPSRYYWDGVPRATAYRVDAYDHGSGALRSSFNTAAGVTAVDINPGAIGIGGAMQLDVTALENGQPICSTGKSAPLQHGP